MYVLILAALAAAFSPADDNLTAYDVRWTSPATPEQGSSASMPIGNGLVGANVWVERDGDLLLLLSRNDAWSENERLLKLGRLRIHADPNPFAQPRTFLQHLRLAEGRIEIIADGPHGSMNLSLWIDSQSPTIHIQGATTQPCRFTATLENWRTERRRITDVDELRSAWAVHSAPANVEITEDADIFEEDARTPNAIIWYHRNEHSIVPMVLEHQGLGTVAATAPDPLLHRTTGGSLRAREFVRSGPASISSNPTTSVDLSLTTHSEQTDTSKAWVSHLVELSGTDPDAEASRRRTSQWWKEFWDRSWIFIEGDPADTPLPKNKHSFRVGADSNGENVYRGAMRSLELFSLAMSPEDCQKLADARVKNTPLPDVVAAIGWEDARTQDGKVPPAHGSSFLEAIGQVEPGSAQSPALSFKGGHFEVPDDHFPQFQGEMTLAAQIRPDAEVSAARIYDKMTAGGSDGFILDIQHGIDLRLICGHQTLVAAKVLEPGRWQHVAATLDTTRGIYRLFVGGKLVAERIAEPHSVAPPPPSRITSAFVLQRWMTACAGRHGFPIKFNGSIFTVEPGYTNGRPFNADWRAWGGCYWWQNTRLPYYPMLANGDFECMLPLFEMYSRVLPLCEARAHLYHNAQGAYFPETMTTFGTYSNGDYGWDRTGLAANVIKCPWWQYAWQQGLELSQMLLDYYEYTGDEAFLREKALPLVNASLRYYDSRFPRDAAGKLVIAPTQAVETYWNDVTNDAPSVSGLQQVCSQLLRLPPSVGSSDDRALWNRVRAATPLLPTRNIEGEIAAAPAEKFADKRSNVETPELYPLFPFRSYGLGKPNIDHALAAYRHRTDKSTVGWTQDGSFAALLGLTDEAAANLMAKARNSNHAFRFPAMWGPNFDWLPDQCHGGNLMLLTQQMLMQCDGDAIRLLPAWPANWNVSFKLRAPRQTTVEAVYRNGHFESLTVSPPSRRADVILPPQ